MKKLLIGGTAAILIVGMGSHLVLNKATATDVPPIVQQVQHQGETLDNHEARITNAESNIKDLQTNTNTPQSSNQVSVPNVTTPPVNNLNPAPAPSPAAVVVVSSTQRMADANNMYCDLVYSDNSTTTKYMGYYLDVTNPHAIPKDTCPQFVGQAK